MAVRIGHASTDSKANENQVLIADYYNGSWTHVLRPKYRKIAEKSAAICEAACNNNNILYSMSRRNSLRAEALKIANLADNNDNLINIEVEDIKNITKTCYADCSSFMNFCAMVGGAKVSYGYDGNAYVVSGLITGLTINNEEFYTDRTLDIELKSSDYLFRGDILIKDGHTVMVLDNGCRASESGWHYQDEIAYTNISTKVLNVASTEATVQIDITRIDGNNEEPLKDITELSSYVWYYSIEELTNKKLDTSTSELHMTASSKTLELKKLKSDCYYLFTLTAYSKTNTEAPRVSRVIFTTKRSCPTAVNNLKVTFNGLLTNKTDFNISFDGPSSWGDSGLEKQYRIFIALNGKVLDTNDYLLVPDGNKHKSLKISMEQLVSEKIILNQNDAICIGVLPGVIDDNKNFIFSDEALIYSPPIFVSNHLTFVDKIYIKIKNTFKTAMIYL